MELELKTAPQDNKSKDKPTLSALAKVIVSILAALVSGGIYIWIFPKVLIFANLFNQESSNLKQILQSFWIIPLFHVIYFGVRGISGCLKNWHDLLYWGVYQFVFNFSGALFGWIALCVLYKMYSEGVLATTGGGIFGTILILVTIAGITGNLPEIILKIKLGGK